LLVKRGGINGVNMLTTKDTDISPLIDPDLL